MPIRKIHNHHLNNESTIVEKAIKYLKTLRIKKKKKWAKNVAIEGINNDYILKQMMKVFIAILMKQMHPIFALQ